MYQKRDIMLARMDENLNHLVEWTKNHKVEDDEKHRDNLGKFKSINDTLGFQNKIIYGALGIIAFIEFVSKVVK